LRTRLAGVFLFLPRLASVRFDQVVSPAGSPGSVLVPATSALLSLLLLKLLDKERRSPINDFACDEALGLFAGLNIPPKAAFAAEYSSRTGHEDQRRLRAGWITALAPRLSPEGSDFAVDFHAIPSRGDPMALENHSRPQRAAAGPSLLSFFAQEQQSRVLCSATANLTRADQAGELMRFVECWHEVTGHDPQWLDFDSKLVPYSELSRLNQRGLRFVRSAAGVRGSLAVCKPSRPRPGRAPSLTLRNAAISRCGSSMRPCASPATTARSAR
jgi:hypothetical protein